MVQSGADHEARLKTLFVFKTTAAERQQLAGSAGQSASPRYASCTCGVHGRCQLVMQLSSLPAFDQRHFWLSRPLAPWPR